jgi:hypothetical protein
VSAYGVIQDEGDSVVLTILLFSKAFSTKVCVWRRNTTPEQDFIQKRIQCLIHIFKTQNLNENVQTATSANCSANNIAGFSCKFCQNAKRCELEETQIPILISY